jgi:hypothetical protein
VQSPSQNITLNNHPVGMVLLPNTLSIDPGLESLQQKYAFHSDWASKKHPERVRLWARCFAPLVVTKVRSDRLKGKTKGYKGNSCPSKVCLCCDNDPPTLSPKVSRKLGHEFCKISPEVMSDAVLKKKQKDSKVIGPIRKKVIKTANKTKHVKNEDKPPQRSGNEGSPDGDLMVVFCSPFHIWTFWSYVASHP